MEKIKRIYYSIGEVAEMMCCSVNTIRFYDKAFSLSLKRSKSGVRSFDDTGIEKLKYIKFLLVNEGHTIKGAVAKFNQKYPNRYLLMNEAKRPARIHVNPLV